MQSVFWRNGNTKKLRCACARAVKTSKNHSILINCSCTILLQCRSIFNNQALVHSSGHMACGVLRAGCQLQRLCKIEKGCEVGLPPVTVEACPDQYGSPLDLRGKKQHNLGEGEGRRKIRHNAHIVFTSHSYVMTIAHIQRVLAFAWIMGLALRHHE
ncbi:hypothetical protein RRG08_024490 [Elysia crispata]|uniref:Uncharacterized protein n=1 Tax=Elysia crispata TaxID=231223 RepID=A0AAE0YPH4_9GAST|nr:hypothetical protein RRG08_024490 [Elysia crispata]